MFYRSVHEHFQNAAGLWVCLALAERSSFGVAFLSSFRVSVQSGPRFRGALGAEAADAAEFESDESVLKASLDGPLSNLV